MKLGLFEKITFFVPDPLTLYDHQFMKSDLAVKRHDSYSWYRFCTIKALVEAVVSNDGFSVICRGMFCSVEQPDRDLSNKIIRLSKKSF